MTRRLKYNYKNEIGVVLGITSTSPSMHEFNLNSDSHRIATPRFINNTSNRVEEVMEGQWRLVAEVRWRGQSGGGRGG